MSDKAIFRQLCERDLNSGETKIHQHSGRSLDRLTIREKGPKAALLNGFYCGSD